MNFFINTSKLLNVLGIGVVKIRFIRFPHQRLKFFLVLSYLHLVNMYWNVRMIKIYSCVKNNNPFATGCITYVFVKTIVRKKSYVHVQTWCCWFFSLKLPKLSLHFEWSTILDYFGAKSKKSYVVRLILLIVFELDSYQNFFKDNSRTYISKYL